MSPHGRLREMRSDHLRATWVLAGQVLSGSPQLSIPLWGHSFPLIHWGVHALSGLDL